MSTYDTHLEQAIRILDTATFPGPSRWSNRPVVHMRIDASAAGENAADRLYALMSESGLESPSTGEMWRDVGAIVEGIAFEMQGVAEDDVSFSASRHIGGGQFEVVLEFHQAELATAVLTLTVELLSQMLHPTDPTFDFQAAFQTRVARLIAARPMNPQEDALFAAARARDIPIRWVAPPSLLIELGTGRYLQRYRDMTTSRSSHLGNSISGNKALTLRLLREVGIPVPTSIVTRTVHEALAAADEIGYPVVVKPVAGMQGRGIGVDIRDPDKLELFFGIASSVTRNSSVIVEQFLPGREHRILVIAGRIAAVAERRPAHVTGDGVHTIAELIQITNTDPLRGRGHTRILTNITADVATIDALERVGMTLESIPSRDEHVKVKLASNLSQGGTSVDRTDEIHPDNAYLAMLAARTLDIEICGVDMITPDISQSIWEVGGGIIELNWQPGSRLHLVPQVGQSRDLGVAVLDALFPPGTPTRIPVIAVLGGERASRVARLVGAMTQAAGYSTGVTTTNFQALGSDEMRRPDLAGRTHHRLVLHNPYAEMAVLQVEPRDLDAPGLMFEQCDVVVLPEPLTTAEEGMRSDARVLLSLLPASGAAVVNLDDHRLMNISPHLPTRTIGFTLDPDRSHLSAWSREGKDAVCWQDGAVVLVKSGNREVLVRHDAANAESLAVLLPAVAAAVALDIPAEVVAETLASM